MEPIFKKVYQFSTYSAPIDFTIHQYLLCGEPAILFATGTEEQTIKILPQVRTILKNKTLDYVFVSHMESDECGGLSVIAKEYPNVTVICSNLCARELPGFGYKGKIFIANTTKPLCDREITLHFFEYPSEIHLQNGIVCAEKTTGLFYK